MMLDEQAIERYLKGDRACLGFNLTGYVPALDVTVAPQDFGYIEIRRIYVSAVTPVDPTTEPEGYARWLKFKAETERNPYHILVAVVREKLKERESWPEEDYPDNDDYLADENYKVSSLAMVEEIVNRYGKSLADANPCRELRLP